MNIHEHQAKALFAEYGIPVPAGSVRQVLTAVEQLDSEAGAVKAQVHTLGSAAEMGARMQAVLV
ncbi:MAG: hypothetical protein BMS9Abin36_0643 [Gammaproteobacteria bacterium]|nr:MAG: hypothetical protein BMS9Abin36_0643 [Gammaproteobacteria bacterium]